MNYTLTAREQLAFVQRDYERIRENYIGRAYYWVGDFCVPVSLLTGAVECTGRYKHENGICYAEVKGKGVVGRDDVRNVVKWLDVSYIFRINPDGVWTWISQENLAKEKEILERISLEIHNLLSRCRDRCNYSSEIDAHYHKNWFTDIYPPLGEFKILTRRDNSPPKVEHLVRYEGKGKIPGKHSFTLPFLWEKTEEEIDTLCTEIIENLSQRIDFLRNV